MTQPLGVKALRRPEFDPPQIGRVSVCRNRIVDSGDDAVFSQEMLQSVAPGGLDDVLVESVVRARCGGRNNH